MTVATVPLPTAPSPLPARPMPVLLNGKFLSAPATGVQRVAGELIEAVDRLCRADPDLERRFGFQLLCPRNATRDLAIEKIERRKVGRLTWQLWEQIDLPRAAGDRLLVNLCNLAPLGHHRALTMIHDAQVFLTPESYPVAFRTWYRTALPRIGRGNASILTVSAFSREQLANAGVAPREKIRVIHNGVDHVLRQAAVRQTVDRLGLTPGRYVVGLANTQVHKNVGLLLKAFQRPELADMKLVLFGGAGRGDFEADGHTVPQNAVFAGKVSDGELRALLEDALCIGFPSTTEGFGLPPLESMLLGTPAIAAPCGALPEVCADAVPYVPPDDVAGWAHAIHSMAADPSRRAHFAKAGQRQAALFTWDRAGRALLEAIDAVVVGQATVAGMATA